MATWSETAGLKWRALAPFGVEIDHDLRTLSAASASLFVELFKEHALLVARRQALSMPQQVGLMQRIGALLDGPDGSSYLSSEAQYGVARAELSFHSDYAFTPHPIDALSLHAVDVVDHASSTRFANAEHAVVALPEELRRTLHDLQVEMVFPGLDTVVSRACEMHDLQPLLASERPALLRNPRTGRECLGVSEMHAARLIGLDRDMSRKVLRAAFDVLYAPDNVLEHVWEGGDFVMWDNITLQHARGSLEGVGRRVLQRVAVGEKSLQQMCPQLFAKAAAS